MIPSNLEKCLMNDLFYQCRILSLDLIFSILSRSVELKSNTHVFVHFSNISVNQQLSGMHSKRPKINKCIKYRIARIWGQLHFALHRMWEKRKEISYIKKARTLIGLYSKITNTERNNFNSIITLADYVSGIWKCFLAHSLSTSSYTHKWSNRAKRERPEWARAFMYVFYFH